MASEADTDLVYPIFIRWNFDDDVFGSYTGGERLKTKRFNLPGFPVTYYLTLDYDQADDRSPSTSFKFHCYCDYDDVEIVADITFSLYTCWTGEDITKQTKLLFDDENTEFECYADESWTRHSAQDICFTVNGTFTIKELHTIPLSIKVPKINQKMFADDGGKDFSIVAEGQELKVHKSILQQVSPVFARMFELQWKESDEGKIEFKFIPFKLAKIAIDLFYGKKFWGFLDKNEYIQIYQFADQYDITALKNAVKNTIILTPQNIVEYSNLVVEMKSNDLIRHCIDYLILCSQYSLEFKNIESLTDSVKIEIADRMFSSPILKKNIEVENVSQNDCE